MATDIATLGIKIEADDIRAAVRELDRLESQGKQTERATTNVTKGFRALGAVLATIGVVKFAQSIADATMRMESINSAMRVAAGSAEEAADMMDFVRRESDRLGLSIVDSAKEFSALAVAAKGTALEGEPARDIFLAIAEASTAMGLSAAESSGALNAIQQMISKGTVSAEELRGQLGERLPGAFQAAARAMNVTTEELGGMLQRGEVMAEDLLPKLADELRGTFGAQATKQSSGLRAEINRLGNAFNDLLAQDSLPGAAEGIRTFTELLSDPGFQESFDSFVKGVADLATFAVKAAAAVTDLAKSVGESVGEIVAGPDKVIEQMESRLKRLQDVQNDFTPISEWLLSDADEAFVQAAGGLDAAIERQQKIIDMQKQWEAQQQATKGAVDQTTESIVKQKEAIVATGGALGGGETEEEREQRLEKLNQRLEDLRTHYASEEELALQAYMQRVELINELEAENMATEEERRELLLEAAMEYEDRMTEIERKAAEERARVKEQEAKAKAQAEQNFWNDAISLMSSGSKKAFKLGQTAAIAQAIIKGHQAAVDAWQAGMSTGGPHAPLVAAAYAAASVARTASMINSIRSSSFGGGGGVSVGGGSVGTASVGADFNGGAGDAQQAPRDRLIKLDVSGIDEDQLFTGTTVRKLIESINEEMADGMTFEGALT